MVVGIQCVSFSVDKRNLRQKAILDNTEPDRSWTVSAFAEIIKSFDTFPKLSEISVENKIKR